MLSSLGLAVSREIPLQAIAGVLSGAYTVHGGVIRDGLGRIVAHLASTGSTSVASSLVPGLGMLGSAINAGQIYSVGQNVKQVQESVNTVLNMSMASTALSGLGLVTSVAGFAYLSHRLNKIDAKLSLLEKQIKEIKVLIQSQQRAQLHTALDSLRQAELTSNEHLRHDLLMHSKSLFTTLAHNYRELWANASEIHELDGVDEYFTLAFMGGALATSELGMHDVATTELQRHYADWRTFARKHCGKQFLRDSPQRLMDSCFVKDISAQELVNTLDFVNNTKKGIGWIDELRSQPASYGPMFQKSLPEALQRLMATTDEKPAADLAKRLQARANVLSANISHFEFLAEKKISANSFSKHIQNELANHGNSLICLHRLP